MWYNIDIKGKGLDKMIIREKNNKVVFSEISQGSIFYWKGDYFIKTESTRDDDGEINCVNLKTGDLDWMEPSEIMQSIDAVLNIE